MATMMKASPVVRRKDGVTYLTHGDIVKVTGVGSSCVGRWYLTGHIRTLPPVKGWGRGYSLADVVRIRLMSRKQRIEAGITLTPEQYDRYSKEWQHEAQRVTYGGAQHYERWDEYDREFLMEEDAKGTPMIVIARALGRTFHACINELFLLRKAGELPPVRTEDPEWKTRAIELLTPQEVADLLDS